MLIALPSSGVHSNGFSLVRKCVERSGLRWSDPCPFHSSPDTDLATALLTPTRIYVKQLLPLVRKGLLKGMAHITGGGLLDNLPRILPAHLAAKVDIAAAGWKLSPVFRWLQEIANLPQDELLRTFNCGLGMVLAVGRDEVEIVLKELELADDGLGGQPLVLGELVNREQPESSQVIVIGDLF